LRRRAALAAGAALVAGLCGPARPARAFTIASGFTESCHERIGLGAMAFLLDQLPIDSVVVPPGGLWRDLAAQLGPLVLESAGPTAAATLTDAQAFVLFSVVVGVRAPDTGGHSVSNLDDLRSAQIDPSPDSQHLHCLRAGPDDGFAGDRAVLDGAEALIRAALSQAAAATGPVRANGSAPLYLDFYGQLQVEVDTPSYLIGRAMHTLQDCYAHTLRSADTATVFSVLNYIEAVEGKLDQARDGLAHSDALDDCRRPELAPLIQRAAAASAAMAAAAVALARDGDSGPLDAGFAACAPGQPPAATCQWTFYNPACAPGAPAGCCSPENAYCGAPLLPVATEDLTKPYVQEVLSCATGGGQARAWHLFAVGLAALSCLRRRRGRVTALALAMSLAARPAAAADDGVEHPRAFFIGAEGHLSLLSDAPERSFINATMGYGARGGYRFGRWGLVGQIERNYWLPTELSHQLAPGALNLVAGVEWLVAGRRVRLSAVAGPSILWFDATFDAKGTVGFFADLRPAGLRWRLGRSLCAAFDPLSLAVVAPVLGSPGIVQLEYRTLLGLELAP
jgi:hypothetical protein